MRGGSIFGIYPFSHYRRVEVSAGVLQYNEGYTDTFVGQAAAAYQQQQSGGTTQLFRNGTSVPLGVAFVQETTVFREYGPLSGSTMRLAYDASPKVAKFLSNQTLDADARYYVRLGENGTFAVRARGFKSWGVAPNYTFFGGNSEMRGYDYREFIGHKAFYANAELRFPLITAMATPLGVLGGIRGVFYADIGGAGLDGTPFKLFDRNPQTFSGGDQRHLHGEPHGQRLPAGGQPGVVRDRPGDVRARVPRAPRLVVPHALQQVVGRPGLQRRGRQRGVPQAAVRRLDRLRLLETN